MRRGLLTAGLLFVLSIVAPVSELNAQSSWEDAVNSLTASFEPAEAKPGETVTLKIAIDINPGWYTYPSVQPDPGVSSVSKIRFEESESIIPVGKVQDPPNPSEKSVPDVAERVWYYPRGVTWEQKAVVSPLAKAGTLKFIAKPRILVCADRNGQEFCLPPRTIPLEAELTVLDSPPSAIEEQYREFVLAAIGSDPTPPDAPPGGRGADEPSNVGTPEAPSTPEPDGAIVVPPPLTLKDHRNDLETLFNQLPPEEERLASPATSGLWSFLAVAALWGLISLVTPCVFPMIPITVSFFLKSSENSTRRTVTQAGVYCLTIILVLGTSAFTLLSVFRSLSVNPYMNLFLGGLFVFFALSLFGMYEITLPRGLSRLTSKRHGQGGMLGTVFMALTFTIISFTCVAPFLGGFSGMAASGNFTTLELALGGFAFATAFAMPFFLLALFPQMLKKLPKSGGWLNTVKVVMGFLELAAALKFFRTAELRLLPMPEFFTYDLVMGLWIAIALFCGLYLLNLYRLPHDTPQEQIGVSRMLLGVLFIGLGIYLLPAMFRTSSEGDKQRPGGSIYAWMDAFLLPEPEGGELPWSANLKGTLDRARERRLETGEPQYVFVDFTGVTCTNCSLNENNVFTLGTVRSLFQSYDLVQMYTDEVPARFYTNSSPSNVHREEAGEANLDFQLRAFGTEQLPLYVILEPYRDGEEDKVRVIGIYDEGKINAVPEFIDFLKRPFEVDA